MIWRERSTPGPTTTFVASPATTAAQPTTTVLATTTIEGSTTSTTTEEQREAEVEQILTDLWFGWFDAIYRKDADALWDVVATTPLITSRASSDGLKLQFEYAPSSDGPDDLVDEILLDRPIVSSCSTRGLSLRF